jgi:hypothetical protein
VIEGIGMVARPSTHRPLLPDQPRLITMRQGLGAFAFQKPTLARPLKRVSEVTCGIDNRAIRPFQLDPTGRARTTIRRRATSIRGAFDLMKFQVYDSGSTITSSVQRAGPTPTFGATDGAQLMGVYVSEPGASPT